MKATTNLVLGALLALSFWSQAEASLSEIRLAGLSPEKDVVQLAEDVKVLESVALTWSPEWRHAMPKEEAVKLAERSMRKINDLISGGQPSGELLLLKGLTAHYAYNLDLQIYFDIAVDSLEKAGRALPGDCRPLWFLGSHYSLAADAEKGVPLLQQAAKQCGKELPLAFWEDYAYVTVIAAMPATGKYALDQVKTRNSGALTGRMKVVEEGAGKRLEEPVPGKEYEPSEIWRFNRKGSTVRLVNSMYGLMVELPDGWRVAPFGVRKGGSGIGIELPKKGKWPPPLEVVVSVSPAAPETAPEKVLRSFLAKAAGPKTAFAGATGPAMTGAGDLIWLESRRKKGSRILAGIIRHREAAYPGMLFESPHNLPEQEGQSSPGRSAYYTPVKQFTRLPGDLDYLIMIEGAPSAFDKSRTDLELLMRNVVME